MKRIYKLKEKVWLYPSESAAWHFVTVDKKTSKEIREKFGKNARGFGSLPVNVTLGKTIWRTSIFPSKGEIYILPIKASVRKKEGVVVDELTTFTIEIL